MNRLKINIKRFDNKVMRGVDKADVKIIHLAMQNGEMLTVDSYGHVYNADNRCIADAVIRE